MEKRLIVAIALSAIVLFGYPYAMEWFYPPKPAVPAATAPQAPSQGQGTLKPGEPAPAAPAAPVVTEPVREEILTTVETPLFKAIFTNAGGGVKSFEVKKYKTSMDEAARPVNLATTVAKDKSFKTLILPGNAQSQLIYFSPSASNLVVNEGAATLTYTSTDPSGLIIEKKYSFRADSYVFSVDETVVNSANAGVAASTQTLISSSLSGKEEGGYHLGPIIRAGEKLQRQAADEAQLTGSGKLGWIGIEDKYFLAAMLPKSEKPISWTTRIPSATQSSAAISAGYDLKAGERSTFKYDIFLGPKEYDLLVNQKASLEEAIEFGYFGFMAKPSLVVLNFFYKYLKNYGIAIIILTIILKVVFYPLTKHSLNSMKEMSKIQPQMAALKEKYKDNKDKLNKEMMELYKRYKINPLGGCLPMVLQIPVFIALYEVLYAAIELRHAPFFWWIADLSAKDPYYITPLLMGATMFLQQKMTPTAMDPTQAKVMLFMPVIFTFMFLSFPSGLVIYWLVNNVLSIAQQYYIQKAPAKAKA